MQFTQTWLITTGGHQNITLPVLPVRRQRTQNTVTESRKRHWLLQESVKVSTLQETFHDIKLDLTGAESQGFYLNNVMRKSTGVLFFFSSSFYLNLKFSSLSKEKHSALMAIHRPVQMEPLFREKNHKWLLLLWSPHYEKDEKMIYVL